MDTWNFVLFCLIYLPLHFFLPATLAYYFVWRPRFSQRRILPDSAVPAPCLRREILLSSLNMGLFSGFFVALYFLQQIGLTKIYVDFSAYGWGYAVVSFLVLFLVQDIYHYWLHRLLHQPFFYKHIHRIHHLSINVTPFASYAIHPLEGALEMGFLALLVWVMPLHFSVIFAYSSFLVMFNIISHLGYEFYPAWVSRFFVTSTQHNLHHWRNEGNYMLYFPLWDQLFKTRDPQGALLHQALHARIKRCDSTRPRG